MTLPLGLAGMPERLVTATPSRLAAFARCPRRYRFTYLDRPRPVRAPAAAHSSVGVSVHAALSAWWSEPLLRRTPQAAGRLLTLGWLTQGFRDAGQSEEARGRAAGWVERYVATLDPAQEPRGVERVVAARTGVLALSGRIDRLDEREGELVVVDYKTGRTPCGTDDARGSQALALYAVAAAATFRLPCTRVELHHLPSGGVVAWEHASGGLERHVARADAVGVDIRRATAALAAGGDPDALFPVAAEVSCSWCDYVRTCPAGRGAAPAREPWAGAAA